MLRMIVLALALGMTGTGFAQEEASVGDDGAALDDAAGDGAALDDAAGDGAAVDDTAVDDTAVDDGAGDDAAGDDAAGASHGGFYMRLGIGLGYYSSGVDTMGVKLDYSGVTIPYEFLIGGSIFDGLAIGGGFTIDHSSSPTLEQGGTEVPDPGFSQYVVSLTSFVDYYWDPTDGWHAQFRFGWGGLETSSDSGGAGGSDPTGMMLGLAGGYDYWVTDGLGVGGLARFTYAPLSLDSVDYPTTAFALTANLVFY